MHTLLTMKLEAVQAVHPIGVAAVSKEVAGETYPQKLVLLMVAAAGAACRAIILMLVVMEKVALFT